MRATHIFGAGDVRVIDAWVQGAHTLVFGGPLLLGARAGDIVVRQRLFVVGLAVFGVASALIGLATTGWWIIGASLGLVVGGALTELVSWRATVLVNVPIAVAMVEAARVVLGVGLLAGLVANEERAQKPSPSPSRAWDGC